MTRNDADHDRDDGLSPTVVEVPGDGASEAAWDAVLARLASHAPAAAASRYTLKGEIARGGMGVILRCHDEDLKRPLAMKVMLGRADASEPPPTGATPAVDARTLGRFLEEAQITGQLDHPNIVPVHELGLDGAGRVYFTMKLVKGQDLRHVFDLVHADETSTEGWNLVRALNVLLRVCEAMAYAHAKGVIHRDLKPGNVMVGKFGEVYVMDWGLARVLGRKDTKDLRLQPAPATTRQVSSDRRAPAGSDALDSPLLTMDGDIVGTPSYMPPEQAEGRLDDVGPHSDVYAAGAMLYHLLTGRMPYVNPGARPSPRTILAAVTQGPPAPITSLKRDVPAELVAICEKAMARDIAQRYPTMLDVARDLRAYLEQRVVAAYETGAFAELKKWVQRNRGLALTAALALIATFALASWGWVERQTARANEAQARRETERADQSAKQAEHSAAIAEERAASILRLADVKRLDDLRVEEGALWPALPAKAAAMESWLARARELLARKPEHEETLAVLRARGTPLPPPRNGELDELRADLAQHEDELSSAAAAGNSNDKSVGEALTVDNGAAATAADERAPTSETGADAGAGTRDEEPAADAGDDNSEGDDDDDATDSGHSNAPEDLPAHLEELRGRIAALEATIARERAHDFGDDTESRWWHDTLMALVAGLDALAANDAFGATVASVEARREFARTIARRSIDDERAAWNRCIAEVAADPRFAGLALVPQLGLVPLGPDPASGLQEFWHVQSGARPERGPDGHIVVDEDMGVVLVLIPGGTYRIGAQNKDPAGPHFDPQADSDESDSNDRPVEIPLDPWLIAKYEMMQGQWVRATGANPSLYGPHNWSRDWSRAGEDADLAHPVEQVSWDDCVDALARLDLVLPTEAQWEAACRAGTDTPWWIGSDPLDLDTAGNLADQYCKGHGAGTWTSWESQLNDGHTVHARVGCFRPNAFGLHDTIGNVWEWCRDGYGGFYEGPVRKGDGERLEQGAFNRVRRGGGFSIVSVSARSAHRARSTPAIRVNILGCRPARALSLDRGD